MLYLLFTLLSAFAITKSDPSPKKVNLLVEVYNVRRQQGEVYFALFKPGKEFPEGKPVQAKKVEATASTIKTTFSVEPGMYAMAVFHDMNGNGKMDKKLFGIPKEPYGLSTNFRPKLSAPTFSDCQFSVGDDAKTIRIDVK